MKRNNKKYEKTTLNFDLDIVNVEKTTNKANKIPFNIDGSPLETIKARVIRIKIKVQKKAINTIFSKFINKDNIYPEFRSSIKLKLMRLVL